MSGIGLLAGTGRLPELLRERVSFHHSIDLETWPKPLGALAELVEAVSEAGCHSLCLAGAVDRARFTDFDEGGDWVRQRLKTETVGDGALLDALVSYFELCGLQVIGADELLPELRTPVGTLVGKRPQGVAEGLSRARNLGRRDLGQAVVVSADGSWFEEDASGTNALLARAGQRGTTPLILFKAAKPQQDLRVDMPAWGLETVQAAVQAGVQSLVFEAGRTLALDLEQALSLAARSGVNIVGEPA